MNNKIPPPVYMIAAGLLMYLVARSGFDVAFNMPFARSLSSACFTTGAAIALIAVWQFRRARTTIDPLNPNAASSLVASGLFQFSRNPMYLGMALILFGVVIRLGSLSGLAILAVFIGLITQFQIKPEERALESIFGQEFVEYCSRVRRWI
ncbi:MAG: isoprenylcysteine carboxylmethyltransferase family protein [Gammaproteobacteria bacterium]